MPAAAPIYDLMLMLSTSADEDRRAKILADVEQTIASAGGSIENRADWGNRGLAFRIAHQGEADYHLMQFTGPPALLESLGHSLKITDGVLRHRIIKVPPGTPPAPAAAPPIIAVATAPGLRTVGSGGGAGTGAAPDSGEAPANAGSPPSGDEAARATVEATLGTDEAAIGAGHAASPADEAAPDPAANGAATHPGPAAAEPPAE